MDKESYKRYLRTPYWRRVKERIYKKRHGKCQKCGKRYNLNVHHMPEAYKHLGNERDSELRLWCKECHAAHHRGRLGKVIRWLWRN